MFKALTGFFGRSQNQKLSQVFEVNTKRVVLPLDLQWERGTFELKVWRE